MSQTYTLGRAGDQPFKIGPEYGYVHGQHARITIDPASRDWYIEDLKGTMGNGVYIRDHAGEYRRITAGHIRPTDVIRLGPESAQSYTFMAVHLLNPANYNHEFSYLRSLDKKLKSEEEAQAAVVRNHNAMTMLVPGVLCAIGAMMRLFIPMEPMVTVTICSAVTVIPAAIMRFVFRDDNEKLKRIRARRAKLLQCPRCGRPLSDYDVRNGRCSACKAM